MYNQVRWSKICLCIWNTYEWVFPGAIWTHVTHHKYHVTHHKYHVTHHKSHMWGHEKTNFPNIIAYTRGCLDMLLALYKDENERVLKRFEPMSHITKIMSHITKLTMSHITNMKLLSRDSVQLQSIILCLYMTSRPQRHHSGAIWTHVTLHKYHVTHHKSAPYMHPYNKFTYTVPGIRVSHDAHLIGVTKGWKNPNRSCHLHPHVQFLWETWNHRHSNILGSSGGAPPWFWLTYSVVHHFAFSTLSFFAPFRLADQWCAPRNCGTPHLWPLPENIWVGRLVSFLIKSWLLHLPPPDRTCLSDLWEEWKNKQSAKLQIVSSSISSRPKRN
jgi:hypothetical protein